MASWENLRLASRRAARGKRRRPDVETWLLREETELLALRAELLSGGYQPGPYRFFEIHEPKRRVIAAAPFRDRVVHHALCQFLAPVLERRFIARSFSCQVGKGTTAARECCRQLTNRHRYVLKCDVRKFFPSLDHALLRAKLDGVSRCEQVMGLIDALLASYRTGEETPPAWFAGDELLAGVRPRGLPIGNLTSQLWGNFYLDGLDHWVTETERHGDYLRYTDDFLIFGDDKARLWELQAGIVGQLAALRLKLAEPKSRLLATREGVPFCGFRFQPELRPRILGPTKRRFEWRRRLLAGRRDFHRLTASVFAWYQFSREGNARACGGPTAAGRWRPGWSGGRGRPPAGCAVGRGSSPARSICCPRTAATSSRICAATTTVFAVCWGKRGRLFAPTTSGAAALVTPRVPAPSEASPPSERAGA